MPKQEDVHSIRIPKEERELLEKLMPVKRVKFLSGIVLLAIKEFNDRNMNLIPKQ
jgi:hypothetical protein